MTVATDSSATLAASVPSVPFARAVTVFPGSTLTRGGSTMIGGWVGAAGGAGVVSGAGLGDSPGACTAGDGAGAGVLTLPGGLTGPVGAGAGGFTCADAASARAHTIARLENGAMTRRKRLLIRGRKGQAIFCAGSRETADARSVL
ncbi:MAG: hypothetical protein NVS3B7_01510 [Candidatus Elarobacter sp.]